MTGVFEIYALNTRYSGQKSLLKIKVFDKFRVCYVFLFYAKNRKLMNLIFLRLGMYTWANFGAVKTMLISL